jgi:hypothetical protein
VRPAAAGSSRLSCDGSLVSTSIAPSEIRTASTAALDISSRASARALSAVTSTRRGRSLIS